MLKLVATGMSYKEIAAQLFISHRTAQNHIQNTFGKLQMHNASSWSATPSPRVCTATEPHHRWIR